MSDITSGSAVVDKGRGNVSDLAYRSYLERVQQRFINNLSSTKSPLFRTEAPKRIDLWVAYLESVADRQYSNCYTCRKFIKDYGNLATINEAGSLESAFWNEEDVEDEGDKEAIRVMADLVRRSKVTGLHVTDVPLWGKPVTGKWCHLHLTPPAGILYPPVHKTGMTPEQREAETLQNYRLVTQALRLYSLNILRAVVNLLDSDSLYRTHVVAPAARWLWALKQQVEGLSGQVKSNLIWRAVALAPDGFCHPRSSMIGTLLDDLESGMDVTVVAKRFEAKMKPDRYLRPQAEPTDGAIEAAERLIKTLKLAPSLSRRFCRIEEIVTCWTPTEEEEEAQEGSVFGHLKKSKEQTFGDLVAPEVVMTWDKFERTVLPKALAIEYYVPHRRENYAMLATAVHEDAPPILRWDSEEQRNPVSLYSYVKGSSPEEVNLVAFEFVDVVAVTRLPHQWNDSTNYEDSAKGILLVLKGARDQRQSGMALFPEILKSELLPVRSVIEKHSATQNLAGFEGPQVAGWLAVSGNKVVFDTVLRVRTELGLSLYKIDRWD